MKQYKEMTNEDIIAYVKSVGIFPQESNLESSEIGDGNLNYVFRVKNTDTGKTVIVKQALPYLKVAGSGWKLTLDRNRIESDAMTLQDKVSPGFVPKVYHHSDIFALTIMEDLGNMDVLRKGFMTMKKYPHLPKQIGEFLAKNLFCTSDFGLGASEKKEYVKKFISPELCDITEKLVLTNPYIDADDNNINEHIKEFVKKEIWESEELKLEVAKLKTIFMTKAESLLHGDLHTGSIFIDDKTLKIFDAEFAFYGPYSYDIGLLFANILLNYASWEGIDTVEKSQIESYRNYLLELIEDIWNEFVSELSNLWDSSSKDTITSFKGFKEYYIQELLQETIGFCTCEVMRRIIGMAHVPDLDEIQDLQMRAKAQILGLKIAKQLIINRNSCTSIKDMTRLVKEGER